MATSGSFDFDLTTTQIIELAYKQINQLPDGQTLTNEQYDFGRKMLNVFVKSLRSEGIMLWQQDFITVPLTASTKVLGSDGNDYECIKSHTTAAENKPVTGAKYPTYWKKLTTSTASAWSSGVSATAINQVALNTNIFSIDDGMVRNIADETNTTMQKITKSEFIERFDSNSTGRPIQYYFKRQSTPQVFLDPIPDDATKYVLEFTANVFPEDHDNLSDNPDFFQEFHLALVFGLAELLAFQSGISGTQLRDIQNKAFRELEKAKYGDNETGNLSFSPRLR